MKAVPEPWAQESGAAESGGAVEGDWVATESGELSVIQ